jgi:chromosome condensin MukBEF complex kleisin-like MukF subunit
MMAELPDIDEIKEILGVIETRDTATTSVEQFDRDHGVLLDTQAEVAEAVLRELPDKYPYTRDQLQALLGRIQDAIVGNRAQRDVAYAQVRSRS